MKNYTRLSFYVLILMFNLCFKSFGQCPAIVVNSTNVTAAACPSGGSVTINATGTLLQYNILTGPAGYIATSNNTGIFNSLLAGAYTFRITDNCGVTRDVSASVNNTYPSFSVSGANLTNSCTSFAAGGTINASITGGKSPFQYDIVPVGGTPTYGANTTSTSYAEAVTAFGDYRIFAKDACGEVRTRDFTITKSQDKPTFWWSEILFNRPCAETIDGLGTVTLALSFFNSLGTGYDANTLIGARVNIYKPNPANSISTTTEDGGCTTTQGALLSTFLVSSSNLDVNLASAILFTIPRQDVIIEIRTLCGDITKICYNYNDGLSDAPNAQFNLIQNTCTGNWNTQDISIIAKGSFGLTAPYSVRLTKSNSTTITNATGNFFNLLPSEFPVSLLITDACGRTLTKNISMPIQGSALSAIVEPEWNFSCTNAIGAISANLLINGGDLPGIAGSGTVASISGGPSNVIPSIGNYDVWLPGAIVSNLVANYTYKVRITNACGEKDSVSFTVPNDNYGQSPLSWNLQATKSQLCGSNVASIQANANFSGSIVPTYKIYNVTAPNTVIAANTTGFFDNLSFGDYKVKFEVANSSLSCSNSIIKDSIIVNVANTLLGQSITKKTVFNCESAGVATGTGKAIIEVNGNGPYTYEIIKTNLIGTGSETWVVSSTNNPVNTYTWTIPLAGDPITTQYTLRSTDACGNKITTIASLQPLGAAKSYNDIQPCIGQANYTFGVDAFASNGFTYRWVKLPDLATTISTNNMVQIFGNYTASNDGNYRCYITFGSCVDRVFDFTLNSNECGKTLPVLLHTFTGYVNDNVVRLLWKSQHEQNLKNYNVERSFDGLHFETVDIVAIKTNRSIMNDYTYVDQKLSLSNRTVYYRIKVMDLNDKFSYSPILRFNINHTFSELTLAPNPVYEETVLNFRSDRTGKATIKIVDQTGNVLDQQQVTVNKGYNSIQFVPNVMQGVYVLQFTNGIKTTNTKLIKLQ